MESVKDRTCILCSVKITEEQFENGCVCEDCLFNIVSDYDAKG